MAMSNLFRRFVFFHLIAGLILSGIATTASSKDTSQKGNSQRFAAVYKLPVWIESVASYCRWKSPVGSGVVRLIRTREHIGQGMYLQWIRYGLNVSETVPVSTVQVEELGSHYKLVYELPKEQLGQNDCTLTATAEDAVTEQRYKLEVTLKRPGEYQLDVTRKLTGGGF
ncbi:MAG: hypothetical protein ACPGYX_11635 [Oceanobacter sp.]